MKNSFILYYDNQNFINQLTDEQVGQLFKKIFAYVNKQDLPKIDNVAEGVFLVMCNQIDRDLQAYDNKCKQMQANATKRIQIGGDTVTVTDTVNETVNVIKNNTLSDKSDVAPKKAKFLAEAKELLDFLNEKCGRSYRPVEANLRLIQARLATGITTGKCRSMLAMKWRQWKDKPDMVQYYRPATLFGKEKFESYIGELINTEVNNG